MHKLFSRTRSALARHTAYRRAVAELSQMNIDTALDLDIYHGDIRNIARRAVYGA